jgi:hypothetical protein
MVLAYALVACLAACAVGWALGSIQRGNDRDEEAWERFLEAGRKPRPAFFERPVGAAAFQWAEPAE